MTDILCAFCGWPGTAMLDGQTNLWAVYCNNDGTSGSGVISCGAHGPERPTQAEAVAAWSARAGSRPSPDALVALEAVSAAMMKGGDGQEGDYGWNITKLNKARPLIRAALSAIRGGRE